MESSASDSDDSVEIRSLIESYKKGDLSMVCHEDRSGEGGTSANKRNPRRKKKKKMHTQTKKGEKSRKSHAHSLDHLKQRVSELVHLFEEHGLFIPPAESLSEKGKDRKSVV